MVDDSWVNDVTLRLVFNEELDQNAVPATNVFAVKVGDGTRTVEAVTIHASTVTLTLSSRAGGGDSVELSYTAPAAPTDARLVDRVGNPVSPFSDLSVRNVSAHVSVCDRSPKVRSTILAAIAGIDDCRDVTAAHLAGITQLSPSSRGITALKADDFSGLTNLKRLDLSFNQIESLPPRIFAGLSRLEVLILTRNRVSTLHESVFSDLTNLQVLHIAFNRLTTLPDGVFLALNEAERALAQGK